MNTAINPGERFRKGFVLLMTIAYAIMFLALIGGFVEALLLAAVFSGIVYPLYRWLQRVLNGRNTMASLLTLVVTTIAIIVPLFLLLGLVADQAIEVTEEVKPWIQQLLSESGQDKPVLPAWCLDPYSLPCL